MSEPLGYTIPAGFMLGQMVRNKVSSWLVVEVTSHTDFDQSGALVGFSGYDQHGTWIKCNIENWEPIPDVPTLA